MAKQMIEMNKLGYWLIDFLFARFEGNFIRLKEISFCLKEILSFFERKF